MRRKRSDFDKRLALPPAPRGFIRIKFYGLPLFIPRAKRGEAMYGNSPYTLTQAKYLLAMAEVLQKHIAASLKKLDAGKNASQEFQVTSDAWDVPENADWSGW